MFPYNFRSTAYTQSQFCSMTSRLVVKVKNRIEKPPKKPIKYYFVVFYLLHFKTFDIHFIYQFTFYSRPQNFKEKDAGKVVLYSTSLGIVRDTYAKCANVRQILRTLLVKFEERDVFMSNEYQQEIKDRMQLPKIQVPQLYVDGQRIGVSAVQCYSKLLSLSHKYCAVADMRIPRFLSNYWFSDHILCGISFSSKPTESTPSDCIGSWYKYYYSTDIANNATLGMILSDKSLFHFIYFNILHLFETKTNFQ